MHGGSVNNTPFRKSKVNKDKFTELNKEANEIIDNRLLKQQLSIESNNINVQKK